VIITNIRTGATEKATPDQAKTLKDSKYGHGFTFHDIYEPPEAVN